MPFSKPRVSPAVAALFTLVLASCGAEPAPSPAPEWTDRAESALVAPGTDLDALALSGHSICGGRNQSPCSNEAGTYLRPFVAHAPGDCPSGSFHDLIYGGSCWSCPGGFQRSLTAVTESDACWRPVLPVARTATRHTSGTAFFWDCPAGKFWDGWDGGGCWTCDQYANSDGTTANTIRNVTPIYSDDACWGFTEHTVAPASLEKLLGCPSTTPGKEVPDGKPFRDPSNYDGDPASGATKVGDHGTCWTCPAFSDRTGFAVWSGNACDVAFKWESAKYPEPGLFGLFGLRGATELLVEILGDPAAVTDAIYAAAQQLEIAPEDIPQFVAAEWNEIRDTPARSDVLKGILLVRLISGIANHDILVEGSADQRFVDEFAAYVVSRRTFVARGALDMYDTWKDGVDYYLELYQQPPLAGAFYIGTVPPDFRRQAEDSWMQLAAAGTPVLGIGAAFGAAAVYSAFLPTQIVTASTIVGGASVTIEQTVAATNLGRLLTFGVAHAIRVGATTAQAVAVVGSAVAGATIIAAVGGVLLTISIDQFIKIQTARPDLVASLEAAQASLTAEALKQFSGTDAFGYNWALATTEELENGVPKLETRCHPQIDSTVVDGACVPYLAVARAARSAATTAAGASYRPSFAAPPLLAFVTPASLVTYSNADVLVQARATDPDGVHALTCTDGVAAVALLTTPSDGGKTLDGTTTASAEGTHLFACVATDSLGIGSDAPVETTVVVDRTAPVLAASVSPQPNPAGWNASDVTVTFDCTDALSGIASDDVPDAVVAVEGVTSVASSGACRDRAGNAVSPATVVVRLDETPPTISGGRAPAPNAAGWNNTDVVATFTCADALSGIAFCRSPTTLATDGAGQSSTGAATDAAGHTATTTVGGISIDKTPPSVVVTGVTNGGVYVLGQAPAAGCSTTDALSGVLAFAVLGLSGGTADGVGFFTASCAGASDVAGNDGGAAAIYQVAYPFSPSEPPVLTPAAGNPVTAGSRVPLRFRLGGDYGLDVVAPGSPRSQRVDCDTQAPIASATSTTGAFSYDPTTGEYKYEWKTERAWRGTCRDFLLVLDDGTSRAVRYRFK